MIGKRGEGWGEGGREEGVEGWRDLERKRREGCI